MRLPPGRGDKRDREAYRAEIVITRDLHLADVRAYIAEIRFGVCPARCGGAGQRGTVQGIPDKQPTARVRPAVEADAERAEAARRVNAQIRRVIERLPHDGEHSMQFACECGCGDAVLLTIAEYDALKGRPLYRSSHQLSGSPGAPR
jgi:hypothetical protein